MYYSTFTIFKEGTALFHFGIIRGVDRASSRILALFTLPEMVMGKESRKKSPPRSCFVSGSSSGKKNYITVENVFCFSIDLITPCINFFRTPFTLVLNQPGFILSLNLFQSSYYIPCYNFICFRHLYYFTLLLLLFFT